MNYTSQVHTVNGHKFRDIEFLDEDGNPSHFARDVLTEHCGWVADDIDPSFDCKKCNSNCYRYKQWMKFYEENEF